MVISILSFVSRANIMFDDDDSSSAECANYWHRQEAGAMVRHSDYIPPIRARFEDVRDEILRRSRTIGRIYCSFPSNDLMEQYSRDMRYMAEEYPIEEEYCETVEAEQRYLLLHSLQFSNLWDVWEEPSVTSLFPSFPFYYYG